MTENYMVCNCKQVSYHDIVNAMHELGKLEDVVSTFEEVQRVTQCTTGCGGWHDKVMKVISDTMYHYQTPKMPDCKE